jgi:AcrR family transcriptional regulator
MPKIVDHEAQRRQIAEAAVHWIAEHGIETLSQRNIAAATGRSKGNVQHYFPDMKALMFAVLRLITERRESRERDLDPQGDALARLRRRLGDVLPVDAARTREWAVRLAFYVHAARDPEMAAYVAHHSREVLARGAGEVARCQADGLVRPGLDPAAAIRTLMSVISGIAVAVLADPQTMTADRQRAVLDDAMEAVLGPGAGRGG